MTAVGALSADRAPAGAVLDEYATEADIDHWEQEAIRLVTGEKGAPREGGAQLVDQPLVWREKKGNGSLGGGRRGIHTASSASPSAPSAPSAALQEDKYPAYDESDRDDEGYKKQEGDSSSGKDSTDGEQRKHKYEGFSSLMRKVMGGQQKASRAYKAKATTPDPTLFHTRPYRRPDYHMLSEDQSTDFGYGGAPRSTIAAPPANAFSLEELVTSISEGFEGKKEDSDSDTDGGKKETKQGEQPERTKQQRQQQESDDAHSLESMRRRFAGRW
jgi:hypothetical protein